MESKKKRKLDKVYPVITYDTETRTFDRLFKEESLNEMKDVVRKKLGFSDAVPLALSQMRDGKFVDLEDDDDFEAFYSSAYASSAAKVKVIAGGNHHRVDTPVINVVESLSAKRKRKKKRKSGVDAQASPPIEESSPSGVFAGNTAMLDGPPPAKKRRVSFVEPPSQSVPGHGVHSEKTNRRASMGNLGHSFTALELPVEETLPAEIVGVTQMVNPEEQPKKKRKKKSRNRDSVTEEQAPTEGLPSIPSVPLVESVKESRSAEDAEDVEKLLNKKSKKRSRSSVVEEAVGQPSKSVGESSSSLSVATSPGASSTQPGSADSVVPIRPSKKSKAKHTDTNVESVVAIPAVTPARKTKKTIDVVSIETAKPLEVLSTPAALPKASKKVDDAQTQKESKKAGKRKSIVEVVIEVDQNRSSVASNSAKTTAATATSQPVDAAENAEESDSATLPDKILADNIVAPPTNTTERKSKKAKKTADIRKESEVSSKSPAETTGKTAEVDVDKISSAAPAGKTPRKKSKKNAKEGSAAGDVTQEMAKDSESIVSLKSLQAATQSAVAAILARNALTPARAGVKSTSVPPAAMAAISLTPKSTSVPPAAMVAVPLTPKASAEAATPTYPNDSVPHIHSNTVTSAIASHKVSKTPSTCPICKEAPTHARSRCSVIKSGIRAMRKRIAELQQDISDDVGEERSNIIVELQGYIDKKTRKPKTPETLTVETYVTPAKPPNVPTPDSIPAAKATLPPPTPAPPTSSKSTAVERKNIAPPTSLSFDANFLSFGDISSYTDKDLEALIRGPTVRVADVRLPDSSDDDDEDEDDDQETNDNMLELDEDIPEGKPLRRSVRNDDYPDSSDEDEDEDEDEAPRVVRPFPSIPSVNSVAAVLLDKSEPTSRPGSVDEGNVSFKDANAPTSSPEVDEMGDTAVQEAYALDLAPFDLDSPSTSKESTSEEEDANSEVAPNTPVAVEQSQDTQAISQPNVLEATATSRMQMIQENQLTTQSTTLERATTIVKSTTLETLAIDTTHQTSPVQPVMATSQSTIEREVTTVVSQVQTVQESQPMVQTSVIDRPTTPVLSQVPDVDPIEPSENPNPEPPRPSPIISDAEDIPPVHSTPKVEIAYRTRSQRKLPALVTPAAVITPRKESQNSVNGTNDLQMTTRKTRSLTRISELPIPPNPSVRVIQAATPKGRQPAAGKRNEGQEEDGEEEPGATQALANTASNNRKTPAAKTPAKNAAKPMTRATKTSAKSALKATVKVPAKTPAINGTPANANSVTSVPTSPADADAHAQANGSLASWAVLQDSSQLEHETPGMLDELQSSPVSHPLTSPPFTQRFQSQKAVIPDVNGSSQDPLFLFSETQQSFPYSQYPNIVPSGADVFSPNESDDEEEVEAAIVDAPLVPRRPANTFRSLTEIASQPTLFTPTLRPAVFNANDKVTNLYGRTGKDGDSEESDTDSDSEAEEKAQASHIPKSRQAGSLGRRG
ncbi:hypothetical protein B0H34DRAFT_796048 [Crassisporium funariophilum]|nr:hypothetical protein B0H34DRAFT_796048 [Crassisporium funariophilum]